MYSGFATASLRPQGGAAAVPRELASMKPLRHLVPLLGALGIVVFFVVFGAVGSCAVASNWTNGFPIPSPNASMVSIIGAVVGLVVGAAVAHRFFRGR
jgi:hypothetical protein